MRILSAFGLCFFLISTSLAEDAQLRARAFELVERAHDASVPRPDRTITNETVLTFRAVDSEGKALEGTYTRLFAGQTGTREEFAAGDFHLVRITLPDRTAFIGPSRVLPPEFREMLSLFPIQLWHLDQEDVIREIKRSNRKGVEAECVEFDTIRGAETLNNEMCFDTRTGSQVYVHSGKMELENSAFFDFAGSQLPGHIMQYRNGMLVMDVQLKRQVITDALSPDMFTPPPGADIGMRCHTFRRAFGQSMPQPSGVGGAMTEIMVHALIGTDGTVLEATIENSDRPDLNTEALRIARTWTFTPATCDGKPNTQQANLVIRFQGR